MLTPEIQRLRQISLTMYASGALSRVDVQVSPRRYRNTVVNTAVRVSGFVRFVDEDLLLIFNQKRFQHSVRPGVARTVSNLASTGSW